MLINNNGVTDKHIMLTDNIKEKFQTLTFQCCPYCQESFLATERIDRTLIWNYLIYTGVSNQLHFQDFILYVKRQFCNLPAQIDHFDLRKFYNDICQEIHKLFLRNKKLH